VVKYMYIVRERVIRTSGGQPHRHWLLACRIPQVHRRRRSHFPDELLEAEEGALDFLFAYDYRFSTVRGSLRGAFFRGDTFPKSVTGTIWMGDAFPKSVTGTIWRVCYLPKAEAAPGRTRAPADARAAVPTRTTAGFTDSGSQAPTLRKATPEQSGHFQFTTGGAAPLFRFRHK
jgi:hypothetical protein